MDRVADEESGHLVIWLFGHLKKGVGSPFPQATRQGLPTPFFRSDRNILEHLPEGQRSWVRAIVMRANKQTEVATARRLLQDLARRLDDRYPSAAASVREGLEETLTVLTLGLSDRLRQSLATTNAIESLISRTRHVKRNVKRWRGAQMVLRWAAAAVLEAVKGFRRLKGHADRPKLVAALRARDQQLEIAVSVENIA